MISEKDRGQLLRMAGNIAGGILANASIGDFSESWISEAAARIAILTLKAVDAEIAEEK